MSSLLKSPCIYQQYFTNVRKGDGDNWDTDFKIEPFVLDSGCVLPLGDQQLQLCTGKITATASMCSSTGALFLHGGGKFNSDLSSLVQTVILSLSTQYIYWLFV